MRKSIVLYTLILSLLMSLMLSFSTTNVYAATISNDTVNKKVTMTGTRYSMVLDYNSKAVVTSFKVDGKELLGNSQGFFSAVLINTTWITSQGLSANPIVTVNGSIVTASFSTAAASEIWIFTVSDDNVQFRLSRTYNGLYVIREQGTPILSFNQDIFENIRWPASGANYWIGEKASALKHFLAAGTGYSAANNIRRGMEDISYILISNAANNFALKVTGATNRDSLALGRATEIDRVLYNSTYMLRLYTVVSNPTTSLSYSSGSINPRPAGWPVAVWTTGHVRPTGSRVYGDVNVTNGQNDEVTLTFTPDVYDNYYDLGTLNGINESAISHALNDYGRLMIQDLKFGSSVEAPTFKFEIPAIEQHWVVNLAGIMRDTAALETQKNGLKVIKDYLQEANGHITSPYPGEVQGPGAWGSDYADMQSSYILAIAELYALTGDTTWLGSMKTSAENSLDYLIDTYCNPSTYLVRNVYPTAPITETHNDYWERSRGTYNGYNSIMLYEALVRLAELERYVLNDTAKAADYESKAAILKNNLNSIMWSAATNTVMYGTGNEDVKYLAAQGAALRSGILSPERMKSVVAAVERDHANLDLGFHVMNLRDIRNMWVPAPLDYDPNISMIGENGGWYGAPDGDFYAGFPVYGDRTKIPYYIDRFVYYFNQTGFLNATAWQRDGITPADYNWDGWSDMPTHVMPIWGLYTYGYGFQPQYNMLVIAPFISDSMAGSVVKYEWRGQDIQVTYTGKYNFTINAASLPTNIKVRFINQTPGIGYTVSVDGVNRNITADADGNVNVIMSSAGTHTFELINPDTDPVVPAAVNIALGKPTAASSVNVKNTSLNYWPEIATDGTTSRYWVTDGRVFPSWLRIDLAKPYQLGRVKMTFCVADTYKYRIEGTNSLVNPVWTILADRTASGVTGSNTNPITEYISGTYQYVRVYFTGTAGGNWPNMSEIEIYQQDPNLALGRTITASTNVGGNWDKSKAVDGSRNSDAVSAGWSSLDGVQLRTEYMYVDIGSTFNISRVDLYPRNDSGNAGEGFPLDFTIDVSTDGTNWTTVVTRTNYPKPAAGQTFSFSATNARYVRLNATKQRYHADENAYRCQIAEMEIYR